jgi:hypothetical protein
MICDLAFRHDTVTNTFSYFGPQLSVVHSFHIIEGFLTCPFMCLWPYHSALYRVNDATCTDYQFEKMFVYVLAYYGFLLLVRQSTLISPLKHQRTYKYFKVTYLSTRWGEQQSLLFWERASFSREEVCCHCQPGTFLKHFLAVLEFELRASWCSITLATHPAIFAQVCCSGWSLYFCPYWPWTTILLCPSPRIWSTNTVFLW